MDRSDPVLSPVPAGTVLFLNFDQFNPEAPEFTGGHPVVVLSPENRQRREGTVIVVPITSATTNARNDGAVEITNKAFVKTSPSGRSFAVCNKPTTVALSRLEFFKKGRSSIGNHRPNYQITGEELAAIRTGVIAAIHTEEQIRGLTKSGRLAQLWERYKNRQKAARDRSRQAPTKPRDGRYQGDPPV